MDNIFNVVIVLKVSLSIRVFLVDELVLYAVVCTKFILYR